MSVGFPLTERQARALNVRGASVALAAGAGCGKTRVLTERFLGHLEGPDRLPLRAIVALTFTEKAARELRGRVREACRQRLDLGDEPGYWAAVLRGLEAAPIGTFHSFCGTLLRRYPVEARVEPGFAVMDEAIAPSVRERALADCLRRWLADGDDDLRTLAVELGLPAVRQALAELITDRGGRDYAAWAEMEPEAILDRWREVWSSTVRALLLAKVVASGRPALRLFEEHRCSNATMNARYAHLREQLGRPLDRINTMEWLEDLNANARVQGAGGKGAWSSVETYERVSDALKKLRERAKGIADLLHGDHDSGSAVAANLGRRFARLAARAVEGFAAEKRSRGMLDFDDLVTSARDLLRKSAVVREALRSEIGAILVDEFQDTDPLQAEVIELLAGEAGARGAGRLFLVGDTKQSIYRFRGAEPELFGRFREGFPGEGRLELVENFRSAPGIIHFVNALFADTFRGPEHRLEPRSKGFAEPSGPAVSFLWANDPDDVDDRGKVAVAQRRITEARWLARHVAGRLAAGWQIWDERRKVVRDAGPGDVVFLLRSLNDAAYYENALVSEGLDYYVVGGSAFFAQQEVLDLINLLTTIEDPYDEVALAGVLRSPFVGLTDEGLYWLSSHGNGELASGLAALSRNHDLSDRDRTRAERAVGLLDRWRAEKDRMPIAALLDRVLDESGYEAALLGEPLGERKRANCRKLVRIARRFDAEGELGLADFVARLRADLRKPPREEQAATTDEEGDAVRLMSIHQAKGLEFPIVVVPDLNRDSQGERTRVAFHRDLGIVVKPPDETAEGEAGSETSLGWAGLQAIESAADEEEALRLLYVATTRAREHLILSSGMTHDEPAKSPGLLLLAERFDRASGACLVELPDDLPRPEVRVVLDEPPPIGRAKRHRPRLLMAVRAIERADLAPRPTAMPRTPGRIDVTPSAELGPASARLDALMRLMLADPGALDGLEAGELAERSSSRLFPEAGPALIRAADRMLGPWLGGKMPGELAGAVELRRAVAWAVDWPLEGEGSPTLVTGTIDFAARDAEGRWTLLALAADSVDEARERLRLRMSARALGIGETARGWLIRLARDGRYELRGEDLFDEAAIGRAIGEVAGLP